MAQRQVRKKKKKFGKVYEYEYTVRDILVTGELKERIEKEIQGLKVVTPTDLALKYNIRVSVAKRLLKEFEEKGIVKLVFANRRTRLYVPVKAAAS